jgi:hypothetical protein
MHDIRDAQPWYPRRRAFFIGARIQEDACMAKKGSNELTRDSQVVGIRVDKALWAALEVSAAKNERRVAEEARYALRQYLALNHPAAEAS